MSLRGNDNEVAAIRSAVVIGKEFGFGNIIDRLRVAWALALMVEQKMSVKSACLGAGIDKGRVILWSKNKTQKRIAELHRAMREYIGEEDGGLRRRNDNA